jgi:hypothetical protein
MTTEVDTSFEEYVKRNLPDNLVADSSTHGQGARDSWIADARRNWLARLAQGWTPRELIEGPDFTTETHLDGSPVRRPVSEVSASLEAEAYQVAASLYERGIRIDAIAEHCLRMALDSPVEKVRWAVAEGLAAIARYDGQRRNERAERDATAIIRVTTAFTGPGAKAWPVGEHRIDQEELATLATWARRLEEQCVARGWSSPHGVPEGCWPVYFVV